MGLPVNNELPVKLKVDRSEMGGPDTLRYNVNHFVVDELYDKAIEELSSYQERIFDLPGYKEKITPFINHSIDLINAIRGKKGFSKNISLTRSKQQEIQETLRNHFDELQYALKKIEHIRQQLQIEDMRSTVWIVKAVIYSVIAVIFVVFVKEFFNGIGENIYVVVTDIFDQIINSIFEMIGW